MKQKTTIRIISLIPAIILLLTITFLFKINYADNNLFRFTHIISSKDKISLSQAQKSAAESEQKSFIYRRFHKLGQSRLQDQRQSRRKSSGF